MAQRISVRWQRLVKWGVRLFSIFAVVLGFLTIPPYIAGPIGLAVLLLNIYFERIHFYARIIHVLPMPSQYMIDSRIASLWAIEEYKGKSAIVFGYVYKTQKAAKEAYQYFRSWNFGDYIDTRGNIVLSVVRDELDRYTILVYPGERGIEAHAKALVKEEFGDKTDARVSRIAYHFVTHADYWRRPNMTAVIEQLTSASIVLLNPELFTSGIL